ncbi:hybrid sensor histidine kinase/response regulator [Halopseudomonas salegens]|uniref:histidine kinase n=1 Tax=Halopseudomonas salegens TaxID=1434072 RepID=A0A1H2HEM6_9GAMM|nr:hybrid sensor histidine kinase/response regulator [Halopseudomonas salegens]SDU30283.1 Signal transduction histidine kinase [Halopseudomonas salegens]
MTPILFWKKFTDLFLLLTLLSAFPLSGYAAILDCRPGVESVLDHALILEDMDRSLTPTEVAALPVGQFYTHRSSLPDWALTRSAIWLRFELGNTQTQPCSRWLTVGEPRLENIQVFLQHNETRTRLQAGSAYPLDDWSVAARQPRFRLDVPPGESLQVLVRVVSNSVMLVNPKLWDDSTLLSKVAKDQLIDGMTLGFILLMVSVALIIGVVIRSRLLLLHALVVLCYSGFTMAVNGYLFYWPALLPWSREIVAGLSAVSYLLIYFLLYTLLRLDSLHRWLNAAFLLYALITVIVLLQGIVGNFIWSLEKFDVLRFGYYILVPIALLISLYQRVRLSWLAWLLCTLLSLQGLHWLWMQFQNLAWTDDVDQYSLQSGFFFVFLLLCTLTFEALQLRRREHTAQDELIALQQAEHERLESQVEKRTSQLRESLNARSSLLGRISHDLRSPLSSIISYAQESRASSSKEYLERIERHARQQLAMLDDLVEFSRTELQQIELSLAPGYLFGFLYEIEEEGRFLAQRRNNELRCELADDLPTVVNADFQQLRRVLINLLNNAAKFTRNGTIILQVETLAPAKQDSGLRFAVRDSGPGFPVGKSHQMLEAFQRGNNSVGVEGYGLGLSIVAELLKQMDSELQIQSTPGSGSSLSFELELSFASEEELDSLFLESHTLGVHGEGYRIILVDDIALTRAFLGDLLMGYGFDVTAVETAEEALSYLADEPADLMITDQLMPGTNGWALLREVRQKHPKLPVMLYSSIPPRPPIEHQDLSFDTTLLKPASTEKLLDSIQAFCRHISR